MQTFDLQAEIAAKSVLIELLAARVSAQPELLPCALSGLNARPATVRYGCLKLLRLLSEDQPALLYPELDRFVSLLDSPRNVLKWGAIMIIANLAAVDRDRKIDQILPGYLKPIPGPNLITAANVIQGAGKIAAAKPGLAEEIAAALLQVEKGAYEPSECRNVALSHVVDSISRFFQHVKARQTIFDFMERQLKNSRNAVRRKAAAFLKRHAPVQAL